MRVKNKKYSKWKEFLCLMFDHNFLEYGAIKREGNILEEYIVCDDCGIELHDRSGYLKYGNEPMLVIYNPTVKQT
jgi:hypothetical protein